MMARHGCLRRFGTTGQPLLRLVCVPWAGGGASFFRRFATALPRHIEVLAVQLPGREDRFNEPRLRRMQAIVEHVLADLLPVYDRPTVLFGHSMGALIAYELARALDTGGCPPPQALIVSGSGSPAREGGFPRCRADADDAVFIEDIRRLGGTPERLLADRQAMDTLLPMLRADYEVLDHYRRPAVQPVACPVVACAGTADASVPPAALTAWRDWTTAGFARHGFDGGHFYLCEEPQVLVTQLLDWIRGSAPARAAVAG